MAARSLVAHSDRVIVVGSGIIGTSIASSLARRGVAVTVIDSFDERHGTSLANAGHFVPSHVLSFAAPGMVQAGFRSWRNRDGAFALNPSLRRDGAQWLARFVESCTDDNVRRSAPALEGLFDLTRAELDRLAAAGASFDYQPEGLIEVFTRQESFDGARHEIEVMRELGVEIDELSGDDLRAAEPTLHGVVGGYRLVHDGRLDPSLLIDVIRAQAQASGAQWITGVVREIRPTRDGVNVVTTAGTLHGAQVVVAAGVWTPELVASLGVRLPVIPAKGYSVTLPDVPHRPRLPLLLLDQRLAVTSMSRGRRITGRYELTTPGDRALPPHRIQGLVDLARPVLGLPDSVVPADPWTGLRPASPDGLPLIGRLSTDERVLVCVGHGMLGTASGPGTGEFVADIVTGEPTSIDQNTVSPERFGAINLRDVRRGIWRR
jgi:D-amino-acid dehydrogenase